MKKKPTSILAWHFAPDNLRTRYSNEPIAEGSTLTESRPLDLCQVGLHASLHPFDALQYAPGSKLCRVRLSGDILRGDDKLCASRRTVLHIIDADHLLHEFACLCAERALKKAKVEDGRCWRAIQVRRLWLAGKATDAELAASRAASEAASWAASEAASWAASRAASEAASWAASRAASEAASRAAFEAERQWQRRTLLRMVKRKAGK